MKTKNTAKFALTLSIINLILLVVAFIYLNKEVAAPGQTMPANSEANWENRAPIVTPVVAPPAALPPSGEAPIIDEMAPALNPEDFDPNRPVPEL